MTPSELANKIAEEVFRTIERENAIVKAEIVEGVERVLAKELAPKDGGLIGRSVSNGTIKHLLDAGSLGNPVPVFHRGDDMGEAKHRRMLEMLGEVTMPQQGMPARSYANWINWQGSQLLPRQYLSGQGGVTGGTALGGLAHGRALGQAGSKPEDEETPEA